MSSRNNQSNALRTTTLADHAFRNGSLSTPHDIGERAVVDHTIRLEDYPDLPRGNLINDWEAVMALKEGPRKKMIKLHCQELLWGFLGCHTIPWYWSRGELRTQRGRHLAFGPARPFIAKVPKPDRARPKIR